MIFVQIAESIESPASALPPVSLLEQTAEETLRYSNADPQAELSIVITDDAQLQQLNRDFLGIDAPTDVLSFPAEEIDPDSGAPYLGDIIISLPRAQLQAAAAGHPPEGELQLLVVHGVLHLLGHDHAEEQEKARMWAAQAAVLKRLNSAVHLPEF
jgi:probable rRNA maturation factor